MTDIPKTTPTLADLREAADHAKARIDPLVFEDGPLAQATAHEAADALLEWSLVATPDVVLGLLDTIQRLESEHGAAVQAYISASRRAQGGHYSGPESDRQNGR